MSSVSLKQKFERAFRGFDVNNLDLSEAWSWPYGVRAIVFALLFIIISGVGFKFLVMDQKESLDREIGKEQTLKTQFEAKSFQVSSLDALRRQMADVELRFSEMLAQLPTEKEVPGLLEDISATGRNAGLEIDSIALQPERKASFYVELPIAIQVKGTYHQMGQFVSGVASVKRIVTLHDFTLSPSNGELLTMSISAKTYRHDDEE